MYLTNFVLQWFFEIIIDGSTKVSWENSNYAQFSEVDVEVGDANLPASLAKMKTVLSDSIPCK